LIIHLALTFRDNSLVSNRHLEWNARVRSSKALVINGVKVLCCYTAVYYINIRLFTWQKINFVFLELHFFQVVCS